MNTDLQTLVGHPIRSVEKKDYSWFFVFTDGAIIVTETSWRFVTPDGIFVTSEDHEQQFGLPQPVDAGQRLMSRAAALLVTAVSIHPTTGDLTVNFADSELQFLQMSCGYEAWRLNLGDTETICTGGGQLAYFNNPKVA